MIDYQSLIDLALLRMLDNRYNKATNTVRAVAHLQGESPVRHAKLMRKVCSLWSTWDNLPESTSGFTTKSQLYVCVRSRK